MGAFSFLLKMKALIGPRAGWLRRFDLAVTLRVTVIVVFLVAFYLQDLTVIFNDALYSEEVSYVLVIPLLLIYFIYRKSKTLAAVMAYQSSNEQQRTKYLAKLCGVLLSVTAVILYWAGSSRFTPLEFHLFTLPIFAAGLALILFTPQTLRQAAFPIAFLIFLAPPPSEILYGLGSTLSVISSEASTAIVNVLGVPATISSEYGNPTIIVTRPDQTIMNFTVDIACSGIYSLIGFLVFAVFVAYIVRDKVWKRAIILLIGFPLIYLLNIARITIILLIGYHLGEQLALQVFHLLGGWVLIFLGTFTILLIAEKLLKTRLSLRQSPPSPCLHCNPKSSNHTEHYCISCGRLLSVPRQKLKKTDLATIGTVLAVLLFLLSIQAPVFAATRGSLPIIIQTPEGEQGNIQILPQMLGYDLQFFYRDAYFEQTAKQDASLLYTYEPLNGSDEAVWASIELAPTRSSLHRWETCLVTWPTTHGYQPKVAQLDLRDVQLLQNPPLIARYFAFSYTKYNETQTVLYWFETSTFTINNASKQEYVKISLIVHPDSPEQVEKAESYLLPFAVAIANHWQPMKTWAQIGLTISRYGDKIAIATSSLLALPVMYLFIEKRKRKQENLHIYQKLPPSYKRIIDSIDQTKQTRTLQNIAETHRNITSKPVEIETLHKELVTAQKTGLVETKITNQEDNPIQAWETDIALTRARTNQIMRARAKLIEPLYRKLRALLHRSLKTTHD